MEFKLNVAKKAYEMNGKRGYYYSLTVDLNGQTFKLKARDEERKLLNYFLDQKNIPLEVEDKKEELVNRMLGGEELSEPEKLLLKKLLLEEGGDK